MSRSESSSTSSEDEARERERDTSDVDGHRKGGKKRKAESESESEAESESDSKKKRKQEKKKKKRKHKEHKQKKVRIRVRQHGPGRLDAWTSFVSCGSQKRTRSTRRRKLRSRSATKIPPTQSQNPKKRTRRFDCRTGGTPFCVLLTPRKRQAPIWWFDVLSGCSGTEIRTLREA